MLERDLERENLREKGETLYFYRVLLVSTFSIGLPFAVRGKKLDNS